MNEGINVKVINIKGGVSNALIAIDRDHMHYLPFSLSRKRTRGFKEIRRFEGGYVEIRAFETVNFYDFDIILGILKAFEDAERMGLVVNGAITYDRPTKTIRISERSLCRYCYGNKKVGGMQFKKIEESAKRLIDWTVYLYEEDPETGKLRSSGTIKTLLFFDRKVQDKDVWIEIGINARFLEKCQKEGLVLRYQDIQQLDKLISKALWLYLQGQTNTTFRQETLERKLGLAGDGENETAKHRGNNRQTIKEGFQELEDKGLIAKNSEAVGLWYQQRGDGYYFMYSRIAGV